MKEIDAVLQQCEPRLAALILLYSQAGLRISEALAVTTDDIQGRSLVVHGKGGKVRRSPLGARVRPVLASVSPADGDGQYFAWDYGQATSRAGKAFKATEFAVLEEERPAQRHTRPQHTITSVFLL